MWSETIFFWQQCLKKVWMPADTEIKIVLFPFDFRVSRHNLSTVQKHIKKWTLYTHQTKQIRGIPFSFSWFHFF